MLGPHIPARERNTLSHGEIRNSKTFRFPGLVLHFSGGPQISRPFFLSWEEVRGGSEKRKRTRHSFRGVSPRRFVRFLSKKLAIIADES